LLTTIVLAPLAAVIVAPAHVDEYAPDTVIGDGSVKVKKIFVAFFDTSDQ
jgi:hypothetical protein